MRQITVLESEDERGVLMSASNFWDGYTEKIYNYLSDHYAFDAIYFTRWTYNQNYRYEGTAHLTNGDVIYIQVGHNNKLYYLLKSKKGKNFVEGKELKLHPNVHQKNIRYL